jgi:hypothetical protein
VWGSMYCPVEQRTRQSASIEVRQRRSFNFNELLGNCLTNANPSSSPSSFFLSFFFFFPPAQILFGMRSKTLRRGDVAPDAVGFGNKFEPAHHHFILSCINANSGIPSTFLFLYSLISPLYCSVS